MAKEKGDSVAPPGDTPESIVKLTVAANLMAAGTPGAKAYEERNALLESRRKACVFYDRKTGTTRPGYSAEHLRNDCERRSTDSHTYRYHLAVTARLLDVDERDTPGARTQLRAMKREILADQFPYRKQL